MSSSPPSFRNIDRISTLPDSVICHILSFLPTKQSAATTILSKRWNPLWLSQLTLDFNDKDFPDFATFRLFVFSVMLSRNIKLPLLSFTLKCGYYSDFNPHDVKRLIDAVVQRGINNLNIETCHKVPYNHVKLPPCVLTCSSLTLLKLKRLTLVAFHNVKLPSLKTLHLDRINFGFHDSLKKLLDGCPLLEDLQIKNLVMFSSSRVEEYNTLLNLLVKANISSRHVPFSWVKNAKFLCTTLSCEYNYQVPTFHNLTHMEIVFEVKQWLEKWKWLAQVLQHCPKLQNLTIHHQVCSCGNEIGGNENWIDPPTVPKCFSSQLRTCLLKGYKGKTCEFQFAEFILKNAKVLHTMTISASPVDLNIKHQMLLKLSLCPRGSATCKLSFD